MEHNETFILVVVTDERGHSFHFTKAIKDNWASPVSEYHQIGYQMVKDWVEIGYEIKAIVLVDRNPLFAITRII